MGQVLHGSAGTTQAVRRAIQHSQESIRALARRHGLNPKTVLKWKRRTSTSDAPMGPKSPRSTVLSQAEEAIIVAFRKHTLLPLDDCLYALQATIPHLTRSALHRCLQRHGISRLPEIEGEKPSKKKFKTYPIGFVHIDIAEVRTEQGKLFLFIAIDRTSKLAFARLVEKANTATAVAFLNELVEAVPYQIDVVLTDNGIQFADLPKNRKGPTFDRACRQHGIEHRLTKPNHPWYQWPGRENEPHPQRGHCAAIPLRKPRPAQTASRRLSRRLQLRQTPQNPQRINPSRIRLQNLD